MGVTWGDRRTTGSTRARPAGPGATRLLPLAVLAGCLAVPASAVGYFAGYDPLQPGSTSEAHGVARGDRVVVRYRHGGATVVGQSVHNAGRFPVRVLGLGPATPVADGYDPWADVTAYPVGRPQEPRRLPFTLASGEDVMLRVAVPLTYCSLFPGGARVDLTVLPVRWSVFGREQTTDVPLEQPVTLEATSNCAAR